MILDKMRNNTHLNNGLDTMRIIIRENNNWYVDIYRIGDNINVALRSQENTAYVILVTIDRSKYLLRYINRWALKPLLSGALVSSHSGLSTNDEFGVKTRHMYNNDRTIRYMGCNK